MPKDTEEKLEKEQWPPFIQLSEDSEPIQMTEMDVSWVFCSVLNMKWAEAQSVKDVSERKFLYNKSMMIADAMQKEQEMLAEKQKELEGKVDAQIANMGQPPELTTPPNL